MKKSSKIIIAVLAVLLCVGIAVGAYFGLSKKPVTYENETRSMWWRGPDLTGEDAVLVPASGVTRRNVTAVVYDRVNGEDLWENPVTYTLDKEVEGVSLEGNMLLVSADVKESVNVTVTATDAAEGVQNPVYRSKKVEIVKDGALKDVPANPLEKEGWKLYYHDEFDGDALDMQAWSPYYLRHWSDFDERTKANYFFEDGSLVLRCAEGLERWSSQDGNKVQALMSYEKNYLHKFGQLGSAATFNREIPTFDGIATKYGYFEMRLKMPNTRDGSHFAWWMVGVQDDMNSTAQLSGSPTSLYGHYSNETGEFDIIETTISSLSGMKKWRPVIHPNGTTDYEYLWVEESTIPGDPSNEYHIYGFEWDENGTKFYVDNQLVKETDRSPNYRMMTFISTYATGGMGDDRNIYPKDTCIDYFRIYKKDEAAKPSTVVLNNYQTPDFVQIPSAGTNTVQMQATVLDQFDKPIAANVKWKLSETVDGFTPADTKSAAVRGVSMDEKTGLLTVTAEASEADNLFVTAYVDNHVKQTYHIRLSREDALPERVFFNAPQSTVKAGESADLSAQLYDQYGKPMHFFKTHYQISEDLTSNTVKQISGVSVNSNGTVTVSKDVPAGTQIVVTAKCGGKYNVCILEVTA